jgi:membrane protein
MQSKNVLKQLLQEISRDRVSLIAAGCTYYVLLALFPALVAFVSLYGFIADPESIGSQVAFLSDLLPDSAIEIIQEQMNRLASTGSGSLSLGLVAGIATATWSANGGIKTLFQAMNVAHGLTEQRTFIRLNLVTLGFTLGGMLLAIALIAGIGIVPIVLNFAGLGGPAKTLISVLRWPLLLVLLLLGLTVLYRYGPSRSPARWRNALPGSLLAATGWVIASLLFSWYLANFANYNATYGSLGTIIGALVWTWISMFVVIVGAEFNATLEATRGRQSPAAKEGGEQTEASLPARVRRRGTTAVDGADVRKAGTRTEVGAIWAGFIVGSRLRRLARALRRRLSAYKTPSGNEPS